MSTRNKEIVRRYRAGENVTVLAAAYGVTRQRVFQILQTLIEPAELQCLSQANKAVGRPWDDHPLGRDYMAMLHQRGQANRKDLWPKERIESLLSLRARGRTFAEISQELGLSRNAIAGQLFRLRAKQLA